MTRSIFDPGGRETERSGSTFRGPEGQSRSQLPPDVADGEVSAEEQRDAKAVEDADATRLSPQERIAAIPPDVGSDAQRGPDA